jgi:hypothetical protein
MGGMRPLFHHWYPQSSYVSFIIPGKIGSSLGIVTSIHAWHSYHYGIISKGLTVHLFSFYTKNICFCNLNYSNLCLIDMIYLYWINFLILKFIFQQIVHMYQYNDCLTQHSFGYNVSTLYWVIIRPI